MNRKFAFTLLFLPLFALACGGEKKPGSSASDSAHVASSQQPATVENIDAAKLKSLLSAESKPQLLDVRTPGEWEGGILPGAQKMDFQADDFQKSLEGLDKSKTYVVYCAAGGRSAKAASMMTGMGFAHVMNLEGGMGAWQEAGGEVVK